MHCSPACSQTLSVSPSCSFKVWAFISNTPSCLQPERNFPMGRSACAVQACDARVQAHAVCVGCKVGSSHYEHHNDIHQRPAAPAVVTGQAACNPGCLLLHSGIATAHAAGQRHKCPFSQRICGFCTAQRCDCPEAPHARDHKCAML